MATVRSGVERANGVIGYQSRGLAGIILFLCISYRKAILSLFLYRRLFALFRPKLSYFLRPSIFSKVEVNSCTLS